MFYPIQTCSGKDAKGKEYTAELEFFAEVDPKDEVSGFLAASTKHVSRAWRLPVHPSVRDSLPTALRCWMDFLSGIPQGFALHCPHQQLNLRESVIAPTCYPPQAGKFDIKPRSIQFHVMKADKDAEFWPRLLKDKSKEKGQVTIDWSRYVDEDEEKEGFDTSQFGPGAMNFGGEDDMGGMMGGMGGMPGMGGMGGGMMGGMGGGMMGGMPGGMGGGMGGMDIQALMAQLGKGGGMGGMGGGMGDFGEGEGGEGDSDDDLPDLAADDEEEEGKQ